MSDAVARPHPCEGVVPRLERGPPKRRRRRPGAGPGRVLAALHDLLERRPEVERGRVAPLRALAVALGTCRVLVDRAAVGEDDAVALLRELATDEPEGDVAGDEVRRAVEAVLPASSARRP